MKSLLTAFRPGRPVRPLRFWTLVGALILLGGCGGESEPSSVPPSASSSELPSASSGVEEIPSDATGASEEVPDLEDVATLRKADIERDPSPGTEGLEELGAALADFSFDLLRALLEIEEEREGEDGDEEEESILFSPISLMYPLTALWEGSLPPTRGELHAGLRMRLEDEALHEAMNALEQALGSPTEDAALRNTNAVWLAERFRVNPDWLAVLARHYGSGVYQADFRDEAVREAVVLALNEWVSHHTQGLIPTLLRNSDISETTALILVNALYLRDAWRMPFDPERTEAGAPVFRTLDGSTVEAHMMRNLSDHHAYAEVEGVQVVSLPLAELPVDALVVLPSEGEEDAFLSGLDATVLRSLRSGLRNQRGLVQLPRLRLEASPDVFTALQGPMGLEEPFRAGDYLGLGSPDPGSGADALRVSRIGHKAVLELDESGVEAAAATVVVVAETGSSREPEEPFDFRADRPFLLLLVHRHSDAPLFVAWVRRPTSGGAN
ncbi:MAG: serpin family protein [Deltaproteobacteria bacterium]|nr:MAG: serpin family protein [Deltaproteobacteria bacterium]